MKASTRGKRTDDLIRLSRDPQNDQVAWDTIELTFGPAAADHLDICQALPAALNESIESQARRVFDLLTKWKSEA